LGEATQKEKVDYEELKTWTTKSGGKRTIPTIAAKTATTIMLKKIGEVPRL
jgi:hypothetical protein